MGEHRPYLCKACRNAWEAANPVAADGEASADDASGEESEPEEGSDEGEPDDTSGNPEVTLEDGRVAAPSAMLGCNAEEDGKLCQAAFSTIIKDKRFPDGEARLCPKHFKSWQPDPESVKPAKAPSKKRRKKAS